MPSVTVPPPPTPYSSLRVLNRLDLTKAIPLAGPLTIYLEPTNICNFKCVYCPESLDNYKEAAGGRFQLSLDDFKAIAPQIKDLGTVKTLNFYMMGEPFVNKQLTQFVSIAKAATISERVIVTSNGTLVRPHIYKDICDSGLDYLRVSIYGSNEDAHKANTQSPFRLSLIKENILGLKQFRDQLGQRRPFIYIKMIESPNPDDNVEFRRMFAEVGDELFIEPAMNWNDPENNNFLGAAKDTPLNKQYFSAKKEVCPFPFYTLVIHSDLRVSVCCVDWNKQAVVGNLRHESLSDIWKGDNLRAFQLKHLQRKRHELSGCSTCTYLHTAPDNIDSLTDSVFAERASAVGAPSHREAK